jgi:hypothetical protein
MGLLDIYRTLQRSNNIVISFVVNAPSIFTLVASKLSTFRLHIYPLQVTVICSMTRYRHWSLAACSRSPQQLLTYHAGNKHSIWRHFLKALQQEPACFFFCYVVNSTHYVYSTFIAPVDVYEFKGSTSDESVALARELWLGCNRNANAARVNPMV